MSSAPAPMAAESPWSSKPIEVARKLYTGDLGLAHQLRLRRVSTSAWATPGLLAGPVKRDRGGQAAVDQVLLAGQFGLGEVAVGDGGVQIGPRDPQHRLGGIDGSAAGPARRCARPAQPGWSGACVPRRFRPPPGRRG